MKITRRTAFSLFGTAPLIGATRNTGEEMSDFVNLFPERVPAESVEPFDWSKAVHEGWAKDRKTAIDSLSECPMGFGELLYSVVLNKPEVVLHILEAIDIALMQKGGMVSDIEISSHELRGPCGMILEWSDYILRLWHLRDLTAITSSAAKEIFASKKLSLISPLRGARDRYDAARKLLYG